MIETDKKQLIQVVTKLCRGGYKSEGDLNDDIDFVLNSVNDPEVTTYIYSTKYSLTPEQIVDKALAYKPIITAPPK